MILLNFNDNYTYQNQLMPNKFGEWKRSLLRRLLNSGICKHICSVYAWFEYKYSHERTFWRTAESRIVCVRDFFTCLHNMTVVLNAIAAYAAVRWRILNCKSKWQAKQTPKIESIAEIRVDRKSAATIAWHSNFVEAACAH